MYLDFDLIRLTLLTVLLASAVMAIKILYDLSSKYYRQLYLRSVRADLIVGFLLGFILPWRESIGLAAATATAIIFLGLSVTIFLGTKPARLKIISMRRERFRELFLHFSITTGIIGIITTLLSIVAPPILELSLGTLVPLTFDSLSVMSALMEYTFPSQHHGVIYAQIYELLKKKNEEHKNKITLDDIERIAHETVHSYFEVLDAIQTVVDQGFANRDYKGFKLNPDGLKLLKIEWQESSIRIKTLVHRIEEEINNLEKDLSIKPKQSLNKIHYLSHLIVEFSSNFGILVDLNWMNRIRQKLKDLHIQMQ